MTPRICTLVAVAALAAGCGEAGRPDTGLDLLLRVRDGQLASGPVPAPSGGPEIALVQVPLRTVQSGRTGYRIFGRAAAGSHAVHVGLDGDPDHWVMPVGLPDDVVPEEREWSATLDFSPDLPRGAVNVAVAASDATARLGSTQIVALTSVGTSTAPLELILRWDTQVDLDLHAITPAGIHIHAKNINAYEPPEPGEPPDPPDAFRDGATLDIDSNGGCLIDGRRNERITWPQAPAAGRYVAFVDLFNLCGQSGVRFVLTAHRDGVELARARGSLLPFDARAHPLGPGDAPGLRALEIDIEE